MNMEALILAILFQSSQTFEGLYGACCMRIKQNPSADSFKSVLETMIEKGFAQARKPNRTAEHWRYCITLDGRLVHGINEKVGRLRRLHEDLFVAIFPPDSTRSAIAQIGEQPRCESQHEAKERQREISLRLGTVGPNEAEFEQSCLYDLWPAILQSIRSGEEGGFRICTVIKHLWINMYNTEGSPLATIYFGPFEEPDPDRHDANDAHAIPIISEDRVRRSGEELASELAPILTALETKLGWLQLWDVCPMFLPDDVREDVFEPALGQLVQDWMARLTHPQQSVRFIFQVAFGFRTALLVLDCIKVMLSHRVGRFVWDFFRRGH